MCAEAQVLSCTIKRYVKECSWLGCLAKILIYRNGLDMYKGRYGDYSCRGGAEMGVLGGFGVAWRVITGVADGSPLAPMLP